MRKNVFLIFFLFFFATAFAIQCHMTDPKSGSQQNCNGDYCTYWKYDQVLSGNNSVPVVVQGCYSWTAGIKKHLGCYKAYDQPGKDLKNGLICICQEDFCNIDEQANAEAPNVAKTFTCQNSGANVTCKGYACVTVNF